MNRGKNRSRGVSGLGFANGGGGVPPNPLLGNAQLALNTYFYDASKVTLSGTDVTAVTSETGPNWQTDSGTTNPEYSATAFGSKGGIVFTEGTDSLMTASAMTVPGGTARTVFMALNLAAGSTLGQILSFATGSPPTAGNTAARLIWDGRTSGAVSDTPTQFCWLNNQSAGTAKLTDRLYSGYYLVIIRQTSASSMDVIINNRTYTTTLDPSGNGPYAFPRLFLGDASQSGSLGLVGMRVAEIAVLNSLASDSLVDSWLSYAAKKFKPSFFLTNEDRLLYLFAGQSQMEEGMINNHPTEGIDNFEQLVKDLTGLDTVYAGGGATNGSAMLKSSNGSNYWVNDDAYPTLSDGPALTSAKSRIASSAASYNINKRNHQAVIWSQGNADAPNIVTNPTYITRYAAALEYVFDALDAYAGTTMERIIFPPTWEASDTSAGQEAALQAIREVYIDYPGATIIEFTDAGRDAGAGYHTDAAGTEVMSTRMAYAAAALYNGTDNLAASPYIASATRSGAVITCTVTHVNGSDITVPAAAKDVLAVTDGGTLVTISSVARTSATTFTVTLAATPTGAVKLYTVYGDMWENADDGSDVIKDNSLLALPLKTQVVDVT